MLEDDAKRLLAPYGLATPRGGRATTPAEARALAADLSGAAVVKALVPMGRRGKAGFVRACATPDDAAAAARDMLGREHAGYRVEALLVEERLSIAPGGELYLAARFASRDPAALALLLARRGGVEIEQSGGVRELPYPPAQPPDDASLANAWAQAGRAAESGKLAAATAQVCAAFRGLDATLLEINPLALTTDGRVVAAGVMLAVDDNALPRQPELAEVALRGAERAWRPETALEARVNAIVADTRERGSARYLELEGGDIGFLCGGGGASLLLFDALVAAGGQPANYSEFGGNPTEQRVYDLTRVVLAKPGVRGLFVAHNLTNNTQVDVVARGVTRALADAAPPAPFPVVARECGVNDAEGQLVFEAAGVRHLGEETTLNGAARAMVAALREARA